MIIQKRRLDDICEIIMGQAPNGECYNDDSEGWPLLAGASDFGDLYPNPKKFTSIATKLSQVGDIIIGIRATIGEKVWSDGVYCLGRGVAGLRVKKSLDSNYLWHWLNHIQPELERKAKGATFKQVTKEDIAELEYKFPSIEKQQCIATILDKADAIRKKRREALKLADEFLRSVFLDMFGDPVANPKRWATEKFANLGNLERGKSRHRPRDEAFLYGGPYPFIQTGDIANSEGVIEQYQQTYSELGLQQSRLWPKGTLCITIAANIGKTGILGFDACFPDSVVGFTSGKSVTPEFIQFWLNEIQGELERAAPQVAQKNINLEILSRLDTPVPPLKEQQLFSRIVTKVRAMKLTQRRARDEADTLFAALSQKVFAGKLRWRKSDDSRPTQLCCRGS